MIRVEVQFISGRTFRAEFPDYPSTLQGFIQLQEDRMLSNGRVVGWSFWGDDVVVSHAQVESMRWIHDEEDHG